jgi:hypothetical protein
MDREAPQHESLARYGVNARLLTDDEANALSQVVRHVFERSLDENGEPDEHGKQADEILGLIDMQRQAYWTS